MPASASSFADIDALLTRINERLATLTEAEARRLWPVIEDALAGVTKRIRTSKGKFTQHDLRVMQLQLRALRIPLAERIGATLGSSATKMQMRAIADMRVEVAAMSEHFGKPRMLDIDAALQVADTSKLLVTRIAKAAAKRSREQLNDTASVLASAQAQGLSFGQTAKLLKERGIVDMGNAERLARTEAVHAHNLQRAEVAEAEGMGLMWNAALYRACDICRPLDGKVAEPGKAFQGGIKHPPAHPNCRCSAAAWDMEWSGKRPQMPPVSAPFHERALESARRVGPSGVPFETMGEKQVLINHAYREFAKHYDSSRTSFDAGLLRSLRAGELTLARVDMVGMLEDIDDFESSLVRTPNGAEFHLIRVPPR